MTNRFFFVITSFLFLCNLIFAQDRDGSAIPFGEEPIAQYYLGFNLVPNTTGSLVHFGLIQVKPDGSKEITLISKDDFMYQAAGKQKSLANPNGVNLFDKFDIENVYVIEELWKLRYKEYPYMTNGQPGEGWSNNSVLPYVPSPGQFEELEEYGMAKMNDYFFGENAFKLLRAISDPQWISAYKSK